VIRAQRRIVHYGAFDVCADRRGAVIQVVPSLHTRGGERVTLDLFARTARQGVRCANHEDWEIGAHGFFHTARLRVPARLRAAICNKRLAAAVLPTFGVGAD